jgi:DnaJ-class molecular chaperone
MSTAEKWGIRSVIDTVNRQTTRDPLDDLLEQMDCDKCGGAGETYHPQNKFDDTVQICKSCFGTGRARW